jgi:putative SOS response-associated peptidase YedK
MCIRFSFDLTREKIRRQFNIPLKQELDKSYNISPTRSAYVLTANNGELLRFRFGLIPYWAKDPTSGDHLINAMAEGIESKDSFRMPIRQHRCIVFADSYYDSLRKNQKDQHYRILQTNQNIMAFAGIWDLWVDELGREFYSFSIITTHANEDLRTAGWSRMPVIFNEEKQLHQWLDQETSLQQAVKMLNTLPVNSIYFYPISDAVYNPSNDYMELHKEIELESAEN